MGNSKTYVTLEMTGWEPENQAKIVWKNSKIADFTCVVAGYLPNPLQYRVRYRPVSHIHDTSRLLLDARWPLRYSRHFQGPS